MFYDCVNACSNKTGGNLVGEMSIKQGVTYDRHMDIVEGFCHGQTGQMANYASVFMVRGIIEKWKLPIGYFDSSGPMKVVTIKDLLSDRITKLHAIGLTVTLVNCDQGSTKVNLLMTMFGLNVATPYFHHGDN